MADTIESSKVIDTDRYFGLPEAPNFLAQLRAMLNDIFHIEPSATTKRETPIPSSYFGLPEGF